MFTGPPRGKQYGCRPAGSGRARSDPGLTLNSDRLELGRDHVVQFYDSDDDLAERVARYLGGAIEGGGAGIVIATEAHRHAFEDRMAAGGIDVAAAWSSGSLLVHDAFEAMHTLIDGSGRPDPEAFDR